ncbi:unnamed protein product [Cuscuta campestris]|uniref:Uncharacterized protein n=1 Tax=Cuscuta campestris TaxID=132261 RepID=A0A484KI57_9ASTE|nr:unnamed protein product [Cuscuta campestris]
MENVQKGKDDGQSTPVEMQGTGPSSGSLLGLVQERYYKIKENAETYPYVWGSYIAVYGGLGLWLVYRGMKLRKTEDRVRALQEQLRQLVESQEHGGASVSGSSSRARPPQDKTTD